ncbi:hypothetical protein BRC60_03980 [Halobacteriales archaeon QH_1_68_42]|nr:MAG: hypothetical protein BRC60_03980 [Halobacteriales archaeon QH_1_68_42]
MTKQDRPATDIYVVGTGIVGYRQLTSEATAALERSGSIHLLHTQEIVYEHFEAEYDADLIDLRDGYQENEIREDIYERMAGRILSEAEEATEPVAFALYGHPLVYVSPAKLILEEAPARDLTVDVRPGVSAMDCLYTDLNLDPARKGIQMYEATDLLLREYDLNNYVPLMIWQIDLKEYYPTDHTVVLCRTSTTPLAESERIEYELDNLEAIHETVTPTHTLYVPPARERQIQRPELREAVRSTGHLEGITETREE